LLKIGKTPTGVEQRVPLGSLAHRTQYRFDLARDILLMIDTRPAYRKLSGGRRSFGLGAR
jgi:hypothetical protein